MVNAAIEQSALELRLESEDETLALGRLLGGLMAPGQMVLLMGDLGAGKTVLARGLARGLGVGEEYTITSPTFTLVNVYPGRLHLFHADLYRLSGAEASDLDLLEEAAHGVLAVEWAERAEDMWPQQALRLELSLVDDTRRLARISGPADFMDRLGANLNRDDWKD